MARPRQLLKSQYETLAAFRYALRRFIRFSEGAAQAAGLTAQQYQALLAIKGFPARDKVTVGELAERLQLRHQSAVGLIDRLVAPGSYSTHSSRRRNFGDARFRPPRTTETNRTRNPRVAWPSPSCPKINS
jgi:DNA-binding MarR family transcriptional regulator